MVLEKEERGRGEGEARAEGGGVPNSIHAVGDEKAVAVLPASFSMRGEALLWSQPYTAQQSESWANYFATSLSC